METPKFSINAYFSENYGLGNKPTVNKIKFGMKKILGIVIAIVCLILTFTAHFAFILGTLLLGFICIGLPVIKKNKEQSEQNAWIKKYNYCRDNWDAEYDKALNKAVADINPEKRGIDKLGIDEDQIKVVNPFSIHGNDWKSWYRKGKDGKYRTNGYEVSWLYFSETQIYIYCVKFKLTESSKLTEDTQEFFYTDIVSVSVNTETTNLSAANNRGGGKDESINTEFFKLVVPGDKLSFSFTSNDYINNSVNGMKNLIRQKKMTK